MTPRPPTGADVLRGVRVLDLTQVWAGPHATMFLADWGAEVIRIESTHWFVGGTRGQMVHPPKEAVLLQKGYLCAYPDWEPEPNSWNKFPMFQSHARNKLSMTLDLRRPDGLEILWDLARTADVLIENNAKETMDGLGVTYDAVRRVRPDIIMIRMPGYGLTGEYEEWRAFGPQMEAVAGHTSLWGYTDLDTSNRNNTFVADAGSGMTAAAAALMALLHRQRTGEGQFIELDQTENVATFLGEAFADYTMNGRVPTTLGNRHPTMAPHGAYPCAGEDEWLAVSVSTDAEWRGLCAAMDRHDLIGDLRFATVLARWKHQDEMDAEVAAWTRTVGHVEAMRRLQAAGVPAGAVMDEPNLYADEHINDRGFFETLRHADAGEHRYPGLMWKSAAYPNRFRSPPCRLGEHNDYVYSELLALDAAETARLEAAGHIGTEFDPELGQH